MKNKKCIVIGGGIGGLATAIRLAKSGFAVQLLEKNNCVGGNLTEKTENGFRFDCGPSILTKPEYIQELFRMWNKNPNDYIKFLKVDPLFRYFFSDGSFIDSFSDREKFKKELAQKTDEPFHHVEGQRLGH